MIPADEIPLRAVKSFDIARSHIFLLYAFGVRSYELYIWKDGQWKWCITVESSNAVDALRLSIKACPQAKSHPLRFEEVVVPFIDRQQPNN